MYMDIYVCKLFLFCLIFFYTRQGRAAATPITFRYSRRSDVTIHKHAIPGKKLHGEKKLKKTIQAHAVRLAIPGKKKYIGKKNVKRLYTHINRIYKCINVPRVVYVHI